MKLFKPKSILWQGVALIVIFWGMHTALAAPLTYTVDSTASLTSPAINFTIKSGSVADTLITNATSVVVMLSSSTGGNFTLTSASRDLLITPSSGGGAVTQSCAAGVASTTISQSSGSTTYTITPTASACVFSVSNVVVNSSGNAATITWTTNAPASSTVSYGTSINYGSSITDPALVTSHSMTLSGLSYGTTYHLQVSSGVGGVNASSADQSFTTGIVVGLGGYSAPSMPTPSVLPAPTITTSTIVNTSIQLLPQDQLNALKKTLQNLIAQTAPLPTRNLQIGLRGDDVKALQLFLVTTNSGPIAKKLATIGANGRFGPLTKKALAEFQKLAGIAPANGNYGPKTRMYIKNLLSR